MRFSAPTCVNLEITDTCNMRCRHCYNFWREEGSSSRSMTMSQMDKVVDKLLEAGIFHVVFTGGEPFANFDVLCHGLAKCLANNISVSCNSNLMLATEKRMECLREIGLDHVLTTLNSHDPSANDYLMYSGGAHKKVIDGIMLARKHNIRVSVNMVVSKRNLSDVYNTAKLASELDCQKIFGTRLVPSPTLLNKLKGEYELSRTDAIFALNQLIDAKDDFGISIGTLVSYPLCLLKDLEKYRDFVGRGCPAQSGHLMCIHTNGDAHCCVHQHDSYGNVFKESIAELYAQMSDWHEGKYIYERCSDCFYLNICRSGCRSSSLAYNGSRKENDPLYVDGQIGSVPFSLVRDETILSKMESGMSFYVPRRVRFRKENGFYLVNIRWANTITCNTEVARKLYHYRLSNSDFSLYDIGAEHKELLAKLYYKNVIESAKCRYDGEKLGLSMDIK